MEDVKISVIMPVFDTKKRYLKKAIESVLKQTYQNFELIIIDDGSNFKTKKILKSFKDDRICTIENKNCMGLAQSLNMGLDVSNGEYITRFDSDDIMLENRLEKQLYFMEKNENVGVSFCGYIFKKQEYFAPNDNNAIKEILKKGIFAFDNSSLMIRKNVLQDIRYSETFKHNENLFLLLKLFDKTEFANLEEALIKKRHINKKHSKKYETEKALNNQTIIYLNMEKFYNQACAEEFKIIRKLKDKKRILTKEYKKLLEKENIIETNSRFKRIARRRCLNPFIVFGIIKYDKDKEC